MRKVIGIGETVLDIIFKNGKPTEAVPGGSTFNAIVSLGRAGVPCTFFSEAGNDRVGEYIINFLRDNGVNADNVNVYPDSKSPVSLAFLNERNEADYVFYRDTPHEHLDFEYPDIQPDDIVLFGSFYAVNPWCARRCRDCWSMPRAMAPSSIMTSTSAPHIVAMS